MSSPTMREISGLVAERYGLTAAEIRGPSRARCFAHPRHEAFHLIYQTGHYSLTQIGQFFGGREHTAVLWGIRGHKARLAGGKLKRATHAQQKARAAAQRAESRSAALSA